MQDVRRRMSDRNIQFARSILIKTDKLDRTLHVSLNRCFLPDSRLKEIVEYSKERNIPLPKYPCYEDSSWTVPSMRTVLFGRGIDKDELGYTSYLKTVADLSGCDLTVDLRKIELPNKKPDQNEAPVQKGRKKVRAATKYWLQKDGKIRGPFDVSRMQELIKTKKVNPSDEVATDKEGPFVSLKEVYQDILREKPAATD